MLIGLRSRKHIPSFELVRPAGMDAVCRALQRPGRSALMAGGLDLVDRLKYGEAVDRIVCLGEVDELRGIRRDSEAVTIGALTTHAELAGSAMLAELVPDLPTIWRALANPRVRYVGTIGGNLMAAKPHYDAWPAFLALGASATMFDRSGASANLDLAELCDHDDVILGGLRIAVEPVRQRVLAERSLRPVVAVYLGASIADGRVVSARVAIGCAFARARVVALPVVDMPIAALGSGAAMLAREVVDGLPEPVDDGMASAGYRRRMIEVLSRRLLIRMGSQT